MSFYDSDLFTIKINTLLTPREYRMSDFFILQTHCYGRTEDVCSIKYIAGKLGYKPGVVREVVSSLGQKLSELFSIEEISADDAGFKSDAYKITLKTGRPISRKDNTEDRPEYKAQQEEIAQLKAKVDFLQSENKALRHENRDRRVQYDTLKEMLDDVQSERHFFASARHNSAPNGTSCSKTAQPVRIQNIKHTELINTTTTPTAPASKLEVVPVAEVEATPKAVEESSGCGDFIFPEGLSAVEHDSIAEMIQKTSEPQIVLDTLGARLADREQTPLRSKSAYCRTLVDNFISETVVFDRAPGMAFAKWRESVQTVDDQDKPHKTGNPTSDIEQRYQAEHSSLLRLKNMMRDRPEDWEKFKAQDERWKQFKQLEAEYQDDKRKNNKPISA